MNDEERAARYSDLFASRHEHSSDCAYCPICATINVVRNTKPEVLEHMTSAARELILAFGLLLEEAGEMIGAAEKQQSRASEESSGGQVRRIDIG
ncbi:MAG TPA: hypothetical protein VE174_00245 [Actinomycetota bacterium]|nr:hypothetical protein [Actinomycetota bacterium]